MIKKRLEGEINLIIDKENFTLQEIALGNIIRVMGHPFKIGVVSQNNEFSKITTFLENLCISNKFTRLYERLHLETFNILDNKIQRGILPEVEFQTIESKKLLNILYTFEFIIFLNPNLDFLNSDTFINFLKEKQDETEIIILSTNQLDSKVKKYIDNIYNVKFKKNQNLVSNKNINLVINSPFSQTFSYGYLIKKFIEKNNVKLVSFEKGDNIYGEFIFFEGIKKFKKDYQYYGEFDYVITGTPRIKENSLRVSNTYLDLKEGSEALMLAKTAIKKQSPVILDNIENGLKYNTINENDFIKIIESPLNEVIIPFRYHENITDSIFKISKNILEFEKIKKKEEKDKNIIRIKKGIDF